MSNIIHRNVGNYSPISETLNFRQHGCGNLKSWFNEICWGSTSLNLTTIGNGWSCRISNFQMSGSSFVWENVFPDFLSSWIFSVPVDKNRHPQWINMDINDVWIIRDEIFCRVRPGLCNEGFNFCIFRTAACIRFDALVQCYAENQGRSGCRMWLVL